MNNDKPSESDGGDQGPAVPGQLVGSTAGRAKRKGFGELSQSRSAIISAVVVLFVVDFIDLLFIASGSSGSQKLAFPPNSFSIISSIIDLLLGINMLRGKKWARDWMLLRAVLGIVVFGGMFMLQGEVGSAIINTGVLLALILLLTGGGSRVKVIASVSLAVVAFLGGLAGSVFTYSMLLPTMPETQIPAYYKTYTSEGFFSISYPQDWVTELSAIKKIEEGTQQYLQSVGLESQAKDVQTVFAAYKQTSTEQFPAIIIALEPRSAWSLDAMVEGTNQWAKDNMKQYVEYSRVRTTIGGKDAIVQTYQGYDSGNVLARFTTSYVIGEKFIWTVTAVIDSRGFEEYAGTFDNIVRSLRIQY